MEKRSSRARRARHEPDVRSIPMLRSKSRIKCQRISCRIKDVCHVGNIVKITNELMVWFSGVSDIVTAL